AGRALALDPESAPAAQLVGSLLLEPPTELPADLVASLDAEERSVARDRSRKAMWAFLSIFAFWGIIPFLTVRSWTNLIVLYAVIGLAGTVSFLSHRTGRVPVAVLLGANLLVALTFSRIASVFILTPVVISVALMALTSIPSFGERRLAVIAWASIAVLVPLLLEHLGLLAPTSVISEDGLTTSSSIFGGPAAISALIPANLAFIVVGGLLAAGLHRRRREAQRRLHIQAWHLGQLLPSRRV
ncbi:MAG: hypothetical protein KIT31_41000, partial [Deltaproteobacteria bacterium]|nr:hypothetical protein [Deltaproteobacteria bacterium]